MYMIQMLSTQLQSERLDIQSLFSHYLKIDLILENKP